MYHGVSNTVYCYDPSCDHWTSLPELPVIWFGVGHIQSKLVAVGGYIPGLADTETNIVYTYKFTDERSSRWKQKIPPMPTARSSPGVVSLDSVLVVVGGYHNTHLNNVEIYKADISQWYTASALPVRCSNVRLMIHQGVCYATGGKEREGSLNKAFCASVDDLLYGATSARDPSQIWQTLSNTPAYAPAVAVLAGSIFAVGGEDKPKEGSAGKGVFVYSTSAESWIYVCNLPAPLAPITAVTLSPSEILVVGGLNTVYSGTIAVQ